MRWTHYNVFSHFPVSGHLCYFHDCTSNSFVMYMWCTQLSIILQIYLEAAFLEEKLFVQRAHPLDKVTAESARQISPHAGSTERPLPSTQGHWGLNPHLCSTCRCEWCIAVLKLK